MEGEGEEKRKEREEGKVGGKFFCRFVPVA